MYLDKDAILESLTPDDVITILADLGSPKYRKGKKKALIFKTVCHGGDTYKLYYYHEATGKYPAKIFHCYSGCHDSFSIIELVIRVFRQRGITMKFFQALSYIANLTNKVVYAVPTYEKVEKISDWQWINRFKHLKNQTTIPELTPINEHVLELFSSLPYEEWLKEGITRSAMADYEIGFDFQRVAITIPHRDLNGNLVGVRGRFLLPDDIEKGKYRPLVVEGNCLNHPLGSTFYGLWQNKTKIKQKKKVIIYEAEKSCLLNRGYFGLDDLSLATCGSSLSDIQIKILLKILNVEEVIIAFDKEYDDPHSFEADAYFKKLIKLVSPLVPFCKVYLVMDTKGYLNRKDSPVDKGKDTLLKLLDEKIPITTKELELLKDDIKE